MRRTTRPEDLLDGFLCAYNEGRLTRRQFVEGALKVGFTATGAAGLLAACHSTKRQAAPKKLSGRVQILVGFDGGNTGPERQVQQTLAAAFIATHPQVGIDFLRATSAAAAETQLRALVTRGNSAPDIVLGIGLADVSRFVDQHMWLDLRPLFSRDGVPTKAFVPQTISAATLSNYGSSKAIAGVPIGVHNHSVAYNVDLISKAGVSPPPSSWTGDAWAYPGSFLAMAQALTVDGTGKHADQRGFDPKQVTQYAIARLRPETFFFGFGGHLYSDSKRRAEFDTPAAIQGAQFAGDLVGKYHVQPTADELTALAKGAAGTPEQAAWRAGRLAMIDMCSCEINSPFGTQVPFAWKAAALPGGPARRFGLLEVSLGTVVAASTQHDLAWEVLKFFALDPAHERQLAYGGFGAMPTLSANQDAFTQGTKDSAGVDAGVWLAGLPSSSPENDIWIPAFAEVRNLFTAALAQVAGGAAAAAVMPQLQQQAQAAIDAWLKANKLPK